MIEFHKSKTAEKLSKQKSLKHYILTALKEIPMVVMSILIALQIDAWYEERQLNIEQHQILSDLMAELKEDSAQLGNVLEIQHAKTENLQRILQLIEQSGSNPFETIDSLYAASVSQNPTFFPARGVYEAISSSGKLEIIEDNTLKYQISNLYERYYERLIYNGELYDDWVSEVDWDQRRLVNQNTGRIRDPQTVQTLAFRSNAEYLYKQSSFYKDLAEEVMLQLQETIRHIEEEKDE